ncbi:Protein kinase domain family protein [Aspergillus niger]|uniref:Protein kinase domain family protein n=1 Tax=Aspergillus niger TaxID=5061 RepID=A0A505HRX4_ASPNG|nr:Protein kinase domain family protein [Aspergillus niger]
MAVSLNRLDVIRALLARDELRGWGDETWAPDMGIQQLKPLECAIEKYYLEALDLLLENRQFPHWPLSGELKKDRVYFMRSKS